MVQNRSSSPTAFASQRSSDMEMRDMHEKVGVFAELSGERAHGDLVEERERGRARELFGEIRLPENE